MLRRELRALVCGTVFAAAIVTAMPAHSQTAITVALPAQSLTFAPLYIAQNQGFFRSRNLDVKVVYAGGPAVISAVLSKSADFAMIGGGIHLAAAVRNQQVVAIANTQDRFTTDIVVRKDKLLASGVRGDANATTRIRALKGMVIGIDAVNGLPHGFLRYLARKAGLDPERDLTLTPLQPPAMVGALKQGTIDAMAFSPPFSLLGTQAGGVLWLSGATGEFDELSPFPYNVIVARPDYCRSNPQTCRAFVDAVKEAIILMKQKLDRSLIAVKGDFATMDPDLLRDSLAIFSQMAVSDLRITPQMIENVTRFNELSGVTPPGTTLPQVDDIYDRQFRDQSQ